MKQCPMSHKALWAAFGLSLLGASHGDASISQHSLVLSSANAVGRLREELNRTKTVPAVPMSLLSVEETVAAYEAKGETTMMANYIDELKELSSVMKELAQNQLKDNQERLDQSWKAFKACKFSGEGDALDGMSTAHKSCRVTESFLWQVFKKCEEEKAPIQYEVDAAQAAFKKLNTRVTDEKTNCQLDRFQAMKPGATLREYIVYYEKEYSKRLKEFRTVKEEVPLLQVKLLDKQRECDGKKVKHKAQLGSCDAIKLAMENKACAAAAGDSSCLDYVRCYDTGLAAWKAAQNSAKESHRDLKRSLVNVMTIDCFTLNMDSAQGAQIAMQQCKEIDYNGEPVVQRFDLKSYPSPSDPMPEDKRHMCPGTEGFAKKHYSDLSENTEVKACQSDCCLAHPNSVANEVTSYMPKWEVDHDTSKDRFDKNHGSSLALEADHKANKCGALANSDLKCVSNDFFSGRRSSNDCSSELHADVSQWDDDGGFQFHEFAEITVPAKRAINKVSLVYWPGTSCDFSVQYLSKKGGDWTTACTYKAADLSEAGKATCEKGFPTTAITSLRVRKDADTDCGMDSWFRLGNVKVDACSVTGNDEDDETDTALLEESVIEETAKEGDLNGLNLTRDELFELGDGDLSTESKAQLLVSGAAKIVQTTKNLRA